MTLERCVRAGLLAGAFVIVAQTCAAEASRNAGRDLAASCASCHTSAGVGAAIPPLAGKPREHLVRAMHEFKTGTRPGTVMPQLAKGYTDAQIDAIAAWYALPASR